MAAQGTRTLTLTWKGQVYRVPSEGRLRIGRHPSNDIVIDLPGASRFHAEVRWGPEGPLAIDCCSHNGTTVDGQEVAGSALLRNGSVVCVADSCFEVRLASDAPALLDDDSGEEVTLFETQGEVQGSFDSQRQLHRALLDLESAQETGVVSVAAKLEGTLTFALGRLVDARWGELDGLDAVERILRVAEGTFRFSQRFQPCEGTLEVSIAEYLKSGYWATLALTKRWRPGPAGKEGGEEAGATLDGWLRGTGDLHALLHQVEAEQRTGSLWLHFAHDTYVLTLREGRVLGLLRNARQQELCLRELCESAERGGKFLFACDPLEAGAGAGVSPRELLGDLLK